MEEVKQETLELKRKDLFKQLGQKKEGRLIIKTLETVADTRQRIRRQKLREANRVIETYYPRFEKYLQESMPKNTQEQPSLLADLCKKFFDMAPSEQLRQVAVLEYLMQLPLAAKALLKAWGEYCSKIYELHSALEEEKSTVTTTEGEVVKVEKLEALMVSPLILGSFMQVLTAMLANTKEEMVIHTTRVVKIVQELKMRVDPLALQQLLRYLDLLLDQAKVKEEIGLQEDEF